MAADAVGRDACVVEPRRCPRGRGVAVIALGRRQDVICALARRDRTVVAGRANPLDLSMVHLDHRLPCRGRVAGFARGTRLDVGGVLACGLRAVVAARAVPGNARVVEACGSPGRGHMAGAAIRRCRHVIRALAGRDGAVVAGRACAEHLVVVHPQHRRPAGWRVAGLADVACLHVSSALAGGTTSVVAAHAVSGDPGVIELRGAPRCCVVASVAIERCLDVVSRLARRPNTVVTALAAAAHFLMIESGGGQVGRSGVALRAPVGAHDVVRGLRRGADERAAGVAGHAFSRRALECGVHVARLAGHVPMCAGQLIACRQVIEGPGRASGNGALRPSKHQRKCE